MKIVFDGSRSEMGELLEQLNSLGLAVRLKFKTDQVIAIVEECSTLPILRGEFAQKGLRNLGGSCGIAFCLQ